MRINSHDHLSLLNLRTLPYNYNLQKFGVLMIVFRFSVSEMANALRQGKQTRQQQQKKLFCCKLNNIFHSFQFGVLSLCFSTTLKGSVRSRWTISWSLLKARNGETRFQPTNATSLGCGLKSQPSRRSPFRILSTWWVGNFLSILKKNKKKKIHSRFQPWLLKLRLNVRKGIGETILTTTTYDFIENIVFFCTVDANMSKNSKLCY